MDPLNYWDLRSDLRAIDDWNVFKPDMKGYISPQELGLWPGCDSIEVCKLINSTPLDYMRDNDAPFLASSCPSISRSIVPLSLRWQQQRQKILGDAGRLSISESYYSAVLRMLKVGDGDGRQKLEALSVFKAGIHQLPTVARDNNHFAAVFVILPTFVDSADIRVYATHENITSGQRVSAIGVYAGVSDAPIEVGTGVEVICLIHHECVVSEAEPWFVPRLEYLSGALPPLRDAFCLWRHNLNSGANAPALMLFVLDHRTRCSTEFSEDDATLLCHLAPLAQVYGSKMLIGRLVHTMSTTQEIYHDPKEYFQLTEDIDRSTLHGLRTLGGAMVTQPALLAMATRVMKSGYLHDRLMDRDLDEHEDDVEIEQESICFATVINKHIRTASIPFIAT
ncbi:hypothetical protein B0H14DRAFT_3486107 [Mycena olivaceomarginata]|nr:hypothetical protein B0H14DRAFT_3486107 [Mycena olivaceomarginata]